jgi:hypothetical protein
VNRPVFGAIPGAEWVHGRRATVGPFVVEVVRVEPGRWMVFLDHDVTDVTSVVVALGEVRSAYVDQGHGQGYPGAVRLGHTIARHLAEQV